ncbi:MAG: hypothetical protein JWR19_1064, partial [Pedosphaera sp.]|nr:hypothetical protein [Pedosphaera sp.]
MAALLGVQFKVNVPFTYVKLNGTSELGDIVPSG